MAHKEGQYSFFGQPEHKYVAEALLRKEIRCSDDDRIAHTGLDFLREKGFHEQAFVCRHTAASMAVCD